MLMDQKKDNAFPTKLMDVNAKMDTQGNSAILANQATTASLIASVRKCIFFDNCLLHTLHYSY